ncbi:hypothetical protein P170DRAFT_511363 [Aspergillus steynii IBT 23096]|uniref:Uncharacterized protein n=1 Tax=Aspergillus steynii IBT 23096 TaxID=1392250 RepID=A0A2I2G1B5_9EURO|nr:uncharacterized protein P170DRAFT_511363 [Aspergillus steynii IBT 23096]PLB46668.1 hypothetical protein P170DRAFT_511363 [Aspergillus steynii IBT 23096]
MASLLKGAAKETTNIVLDLNKEPQQVLHVYSYSDQTRAIVEKSCIAFKNVDMSTTKLSDIRELLVSEGVLEPTLLWSAFCNQRGAKILDTTSFKAYLGILSEKSSEVGDIAEDNADSYRVYLKSEKIFDYDHLRAALSRDAKVSVDKKVLELPSASQPKAPELPSSFSHNIFLNPNTTFSIVHAADMSETQWSVVLRNNSLLNAYRVVDAGGKIGKIVERSMHTAFALKPRLFQNYQISANAASDSIAKQKQTLRIPRFRVEDDSYVEQFEKTKFVSRAIAQSSLSQLAAELAVEGGAFGCSASLSASYGEDNSSSSSSSSSEDTRVMTITYNFPRAVIDFDRYSLDLSEECQLDLASVDSVSAIDEFKDKYGRFFPTRIELGGRLHSSEESTSSTTAGKADQAKSMRAAAALSFSSPYVQASAKVNYAQSSDSSSQNAGASSSKSKFYINVETTNTNEDHQLKYKYPYRIYNKTNTGDGQTSWLSISPVLQGFLNTSMIWSGKLENATTFQFVYSPAGKHSPYVQNGDEVYIAMFDQDGKEIAWAERILNPPDCVGMDWDIKTNPDHYSFKVQYI